MKAIALSRAGRASKILAALVGLALAGLAGAGVAKADEQSEISFVEGLLALKAGDLDKARVHLERAANLDPADAVAHYWLGIAHARAGESASAIAAFGEALALEPDYAQALYSRGNVLARIGDQEAARRDWTRAAEIAPDPEMAREARLRLTVSQPEERKERNWDLSAGLGMEYDTNVFLFPNQGDAPPLDPSSGQRFSAPDHRRDTRFVYYIDGAYRFINNENWSLVARQALQAVTQARSEDVNFLNYSPSLSLEYKNDPITLGLTYTYTLFGLGGATLLSQHTVEPSITVREGNRHFTRLFYAYAHTDHEKSVSRSLDGGGNNHRVGLDQYMLLFDRRGFVRGGVEFERDLTDGTEYDASYVNISAELVAPLPAEGRLQLLGEQSWADYDNDSVFSRPNRVFFVTGTPFGQVVVPVRTGDPKREKLTRVGATVSRDFGDHWIGSVRYTYDVNQSSIDAFDYNRSIFSLFATYRF